jgi:RimJ/RimL family protein N-acetyltransferase
MTWVGASEAQQYGSSVLEGQLVRFRALENSDLPELVRWSNDSRWSVLQQFIVRPRPYEPVAEMFRRWSSGERGGDVGFSVVSRESEELVGHVALIGATLPVRAASLAVMIGGEHAGRKYGTDAVRLLTNYGFCEMGLNRIEIRVHAFNTPARAVYRKVGYREDGLRRAATFHDGGFHDEVIMSVLADEWSAQA